MLFILLFCTGKPHNPMINAGAMLLCALLKPELSLTHKVDFVSHTDSVYTVYMHENVPWLML